MSNHVHLVLLRSVLGIMLTIDSVLLETEGGASGMAAVWHHTVFFFPLVAVMVAVKQLKNMHQMLSLQR